MASKSPRSGPIGGDISAIVEGFGTRFRIPVLVSRHSQTSVMGLFALVNGVLSIALMSMAAVVTGQAFIFPSLGPTAFLLFYTPTLPAACPRNTIFGHAIGVAAGYLALVIFGLTEAAPALATEVTWPRVGAAAVSLGLTSGFMVWFKVPHPPAGATTLIVSLGILKTPAQLTVLMIAVVLMVGQGMVINRLAGIDYPSWAPRRPA
ncbi:MAG: HPP family protein [Candidatus Microthrix sp.]|uniref:HPP family protein n=1 Tax=Candidatus Neomicrothrix subdominans TaxID=2954438 RepID=A0A936TCU4_9ACTN|nr:HPP family protein [Candidatus Microthrix sp.]MBK9296891.1 HPP family protein [Candidatus Microthrix subdominans]MBK6971308.1 HPP family protein [Candidatus Microthrix sp.]MBK9559087.1 HPP family protein [Candidatus Microthrix sp.]MBP7595412.1 HPP family protein [Candidatus Microthrix sp.]